MSETACSGAIPLRGRLEPWQTELLADPERLDDLVSTWGSPLNLIDPAPMARNLRELERAATRSGVELRAFFARKANKSLALVDRALSLGAGVDVASSTELAQAQARGAAGADLVVTAAVKTRPLIELCLREGATCVIDNVDELDLALAVARDHGRGELSVGFRLAATAADPARPPTRFGLDADTILALVRRHWRGDRAPRLRIDGIQFHIDGYEVEDRRRAAIAGLRLADAMAELGQRVRWLDIGGGIPMCYLADPSQWDEFWDAHRRALLGHGAPLTYCGHGLGLTRDGDRIRGMPAAYPVGQELIRGPWLGALLSGEGPDGTLAEGISRRGIELRCEPGRALLDGCGITLARVAFRKRGGGGDLLVGLEMNRTQLRSTADDSMIDPLLVRPEGAGAPIEPADGYLVGAFCIERELISQRLMTFPRGVAVGDIVAFPNTAGYFMHILESESHGLPLAVNLVARRGGFEPDPVDAARVPLIRPNGRPPEWTLFTAGRAGKAPT